MKVTRVSPSKPYQSTIAALALAFLWCFGVRIPWDQSLMRAKMTSVYFQLSNAQADLSSERPFSSLSVHEEKELLYLIPSGEQLYADGNRAQEHLFNRIYEAYCTEENGSASSLVIDVGGLLGDFSLKAASAGCRAICFEPQQGFYNLIRATIILNGLENKISVIKAAIGEIHDRVLYYGSGTHGGNAGFFIDPPPNQPLSQIKSYRLDRLFGSSDVILLLKIDVEGFDAAAVFSTEKLVQNNQIKHMFFEYTPFWNSEGQGRWLEVLMWLSSLAHPPRLYALHRTGTDCYGPISRNEIGAFHIDHVKRHLQTDIYAIWDQTFDPMCAGAWNGTIFA